MKNWKWKNLLRTIPLDLMLALEISLMADAVIVFFEKKMTPLMFVAAVGLITVVFALCRKFTNRKKLYVATALLAVAALTCVLGSLVWSEFRENAPYMDVDTGKERLYAGHSVMVIVPHQDDECNILGGVLEEFTAYGSEVTVVYTTNGDMEVPAESRMEDARNYCAAVGIPAENVIFLGYGDRWQDPQPDIYNAQPEEELISAFGAAKTYGSDTVKPWRDGRTYTRSHICQDIKSVITAYSPEIIFCIDNDDHIGHISTSLLFEEVMGQILKETPQYRPLVLKGFAYGTAWFAQNDYFRLNMLATQNLFAEPYWQYPAVYEWEDRVRFPVDASILSRSAVNSAGYEKLGLFASQPSARANTPNVINGDKVFWQRRTDSVCNGAQITVSSGNGLHINDFKLVDNKDLKLQHDFYDGVWIPDQEDTEKSVTCRLENPADIASIVLYDHPSLGENVLDARIEFDDGTVISTGALRAGGTATRIAVEKQNVQSFTVTLVNTEGEYSGLSEIEAFSNAAQGELAYVKLMDTDGNFAYDYCIRSGEEAEFALYRSGDVPAPDSGRYAVTTDNPRITARIANGAVQVNCPRGESGVITLSCEEAQVYDSIYVRNPGKAKVAFIDLGQRIENFVRFNSHKMMAHWFGSRVMYKLGIG